MKGESQDERPDDDWLLAGELALGLIEGPERQALERRARRERSFAAQVEAWELRFAALCAGSLAVKPPAEVKARIDEELFGRHSPPIPALSARSSRDAGFWRLAAITFAAVSIACFALLARPLLSPAPAGSQRLIAALAPTNAATLAFASIDLATGRIDVTGLDIDAGAGDAELWVIPQGGAPRSIGLLANRAATTKTVGADLMALLAEGAALAISLEPKGGSPTGAPTGPVIALGFLRTP